MAAAAAALCAALAAFSLSRLAGMGGGKRRSDQAVIDYDATVCGRRRTQQLTGTGDEPSDQENKQRNREIAENEAGAANDRRHPRQHMGDRGRRRHRPCRRRLGDGSTTAERSRSLLILA